MAPERYSVLGFHVTSEEKGRSILRTGFDKSHNKYDWLGNGAYFYQEAPGYAVRWAVHERRGGPIENPFVIMVEVEWDGFLDLLDAGWADVLRTTYERLNSKARRTFAVVRKEQKPYEPTRRATAHPLDRYVVEAAIGVLRRKGVYIRAVRAVFLDGLPIFDKSHLLDRTHIQIAVRDTSIVKIIAAEAVRIQPVERVAGDR